VTLAETNRRGHAARLALGAAADGYEVVVALGGDGTLNEAANGVVGTDTALGVLPGGSTNVFARSIGVSNDAIEATGQLVGALARRSFRRIGLGSVNGRYFLFHVGMGFDAAVVSRVERRAMIKRYAGHPLFVYSALVTWMRDFDRSRPHFAVHFPEGSVVDDAYMAVCLNTNPYTFLGSRPFNLAPEADLDHGLSMVTVRTLDLLRFLNIVGQALGSGRRLHRNRCIDHRSNLDELKVTGHGPFPYQVDGDYLGEADALAFRHEPEILTLVMP
jgi:diacylglycerol kinase family enzyme